MHPYNISFILYFGEILYLIIFLKFVFTISSMFNEIYNMPRLRAITECDQELKSKDIFTQFLNCPVEEVESLSDALYRIISRIFRSVKRLFKTFTIFMKTKTLYMFHVVSILLTVFSFYYWVQIIKSSYDRRLKVDYMLKPKSGDKEREIFELMKELASYITYYRKIQGINAIFLVCGIFPYFSFSLKLSVVLHVTRLAKRDLVSYITIFVIIVFGFGIGGYMIYGDKLENFNSPLRSSLEIILMTIGGVNYELMKEAEPFVTPFFVFLYLIAAYIIFLKMFIVILDSTYKDLINHVVKEDNTLLTYITQLFKRIVKKIKRYLEFRTKDEIETDYAGKTGFISKLKMGVEIFNNTVMKKLENRLWFLMEALFFFKGKEYTGPGASIKKEDLMEKSKMYEGLSRSILVKKIDLESGNERFLSFGSFQKFMHLYYSANGVSSNKISKNANGEQKNQENCMNEWFNSLNSYIETTTNHKHSLHKANENQKATERKEIFFTILAISGIKWFRENLGLSNATNLKDLKSAVVSRIKNTIIKPKHSIREPKEKKSPKKKKKRSRKGKKGKGKRSKAKDEQIDERLKEKIVDTKSVKSKTSKGKSAEGGNADDSDDDDEGFDIEKNFDFGKSTYMSLHKEVNYDASESSDGGGSDSNDETNRLVTRKNNMTYKKIANFIKLTIYTIYIEIQGRKVDDYDSSESDEDQYASRLHADHSTISGMKVNQKMSNFRKQSKSQEMGDLGDPEEMKPITLYKAYTDIMFRSDMLSHLYDVWQAIPGDLKLNFWIQNCSQDYLSIHQKFFIFKSMKLTAIYWKEVFIFEKLNTMLLFFTLVKKKKRKIDRKSMTHFNFKDCGYVNQSKQILPYFWSFQNF